ncbi:hypothetical protein DPMN_119299 [Dreissena polymorpha]|uniref:Uncharacterized protein n=1 Tax=Dreissena polymorpha TaxID=45954 RepID=A0A9D4JPA9_DREPO|nr:hypothetical protein DPMN_119299 [Dreissena polymorpha]
MAQADTTNERLLSYVHLKVVRGVLRRLLEHAVAKENPEWTIDHFLYHHIRRINEAVIGRENERHFFPGFRQNADVDNWPLFLFSFLILHITDSGTLPEDIKDSVRSLNQSRVELYSRIVVGVSDEYFDEHVINLQQTMHHICERIHDAQLRAETERQIRNAREHVGIPGGIDYVQVFNVCQETEKTYRQRVTGFTPDQERLHDFIQQNTQIAQHQTEPETKGRIVSIRDDHHLADLEAAQRQGHDLYKPFLPPRNNPERYPITLPAIPIEIEIRGCKPPQNQRISEVIVNTINGNCVPDISQETREIIKTAFSNAISSFGEYRARQGCIQLLVRPNTIEDVFSLFNECVNGNLSEKLKQVQDLLRTLPGWEEYEQEIVLYKENYDLVMDSIAKQLVHEIQLQGYSFPPKRNITVNESEQGSILLNVACYSPEDRKAFTHAVRQGQLKHTLDVLEQNLKRICANVSLNTRLIDDTDTDGVKSRVKRHIDLGFRIQPNATSRRRPLKLLKNIDVTMSSDEKLPSVTGFALNKTGLVIAADLANKCIKMIDVKSGICKGRSLTTCCKPVCSKECIKKHHPWDATFIDEAQAVVSVPAAGKLFFVDNKNDELSVVKEMNNQRQCRGLAYCRGRLYVTYGSPESKVRIMNTDGTDVQTFSNESFSEPWYITVNATDKAMFITETMKKCVIHLDKNGNPVQNIELKQLLDGPRGIALLHGSHLLVCAYRYTKTDVLYEINLESGESCVIVDEALNCPDGIQIDSESGYVFVSMCENNKLAMYQL